MQSGKELLVVDDPTSPLDIAHFTALKTLSPDEARLAGFPAGFSGATSPHDVAFALAASPAPARFARAPSVRVPGPSPAAESSTAALASIGNELVTLGPEPNEPPRGDSAPAAPVVEKPLGESTTSLRVPMVQTSQHAPQARRTFADVRTMLLARLSDRGWTVKRDLKIPWASKGEYRLWFKPQAIYYGTSKDVADAHSLSSDMREYASVDDLLADVRRRPHPPELDPRTELDAGALRARVAIARYLDSVAGIVGLSDKRAAAQLKDVADEASLLDVPMARQESVVTARLRQLAASEPGVDTAQVYRRAAAGLEQGDRGPIDAQRWSLTKAGTPEEENAARRAEAERIDAEIERLRQRAWHWFFRCCDVQSRGGEVIVATATPASNSPVEFYNLVKLMDKDAWGRIGIYDPEAFIDRFCLLEPQEVLNVEMETETRLACVGFKNLDELRSVIFKFWEFKTAKQANLKLPVAKVERVFVDMDARQERKYERYIAEIEEALSKPKERGGNKILGLLARMAMVAMHAQLDEKFDWHTAKGVGSPHSPKFDALAQKILAQRGCGHIVFADYIAAHAWIRDVLIEAGIPAGRIGILNAVVAPNAADRQRIARDFNGDAQAGIAAKYDVLIANAIGEEGVDLQDKTCAIHHLDIGWTPKKTEQRNGRGVRQGNTLSNINIFYYIANRSQDGTRLDMVRGKQNWISSLLEGEEKDTNNPAAQSTLSHKELLVLISRDPEKTRARLEAAEAEREEERKKKVAKVATDTLRAIANRYERARTEHDPATAAELVSVAKQKLAGLAKVPPDIWPWGGWATAAEHAPMLVPKEGGPVYEGLRVAMPRLLDRSVIEYAEFGRIDGATIGSRGAGAAHWEGIDLDKVVQLRLESRMRIAEGSGTAWPSNDQAGIDKAMQETWLLRLRRGVGSADTADAWRALGWTRAPDGFVEAQWARWGDDIVRVLASTAWAANLQVPAVRGDRLVLGLAPPFSAVLPPTLAGWRRYLDLARFAGLKFTALEDAGLWWWDRGIPRDLLVAEIAPQSAPRSAAA